LTQPALSVKQKENLMNNEETNKETNEASCGVNFPCYAGTPGRAYADLHLSEVEAGDGSWIIEGINSGALLVCPRCAFLHLPAFPLPLGLVRGPAPLDACDVCAHAYSATDLPWQFDAAQMLNARQEIVQARVDRAQLFYDLWMGASLAADTWVLARLGDVLATVQTETRGAEARAGEA